MKLSKRSINLAIIFHQDIQIGGGFQQAINAALLIKKLPKKIVSIKFLTLKKKNLSVLKGYGINAKYLKLSIISKLIIFINTTPRLLLLSNFLKIFNIQSNFENKLIKQKIDLVYFLSPTRIAADMNKLNYIYTLWDISHRDDLEFPEVRGRNIFEFRDNLCRKVLPKAYAIIVDSEYGKKNIANKYTIDKKRLHVIPYEPAHKIKISKTRSGDEKPFKLNNDSYIYYPAQFWAHKNHTYLIDGIISLEKNYDYKLKIIFTGSDQGNLDYIKNYVAEKNLEDRVSFLGFVSNEKMIQIYKDSLALVMPSYFGPTNIPPLEAFKLGVPVLYSDIDGLREQVLNAALLIDLKDPNSLAKQLFRLITEPNLRNQLIKSGRQRLKEINSVDRLNLMTNLLIDYHRKNLTFKR